MKNNDQKGGVVLIAAVIVLAIAFVAAATFGYWAYQQQQDYKNRSDKKVAAAVVKAQQVQVARDSGVFAEKEKLPNKAFKGPATFGSVTFNYPKTWSAYVDQTNPTDPLKSLFYPDTVPSPTALNGVIPQYALRVDLIGLSYAQVLKQFDSFIKKGTATASPYVPPLMTQIPNVQTGTRLDGAIGQNSALLIQGSMIIIKVRDKTLKIYTESPSFLSDFNNTILATLTFVP
ncbi:MAG TPA: hypothetical protein VLE51_02955 [Candidatus Saccharimonadales bacterium]|nr:hypothetical protein [Candidatus Saccharimonadales bacterium]